VPPATLIISSIDAQFNSLMSLGTLNCWTMCPWGHTAILLAVPSGQGPCWLCVPHSWPQRDTTGPITWTGRAPRVPRTKGAGRGWLLEAADWATLWRRAQPRSACPQPRGHALPCVTLASLAYLINLGEGNDSA